MSEDELFDAAKELQVPYDLVLYVHENKKLPVVNFAAGGVVLYPLAIPCALANIAGNLCGAHLAVRVGARAVRVFLYIALGLLFGSLVWRNFA